MKLGRRFSWTAAAAVAMVALLFAPQALAATVTNGSFETGDFTGWTVTPQTESAGTWTVTTGTSGPISEKTIPGASCGTHQSVYDESEESSAIMYQDLTLAAGDTHSLTFTHWYVNYASTGEPDLKQPKVDTPIWASPPSLDYSLGEETNQQYRVDIMKTSADPFSVASADILKTVFQTEPGDPATLDPTPVTVDLSAFAGQTVRLRFAAVDNEDYLNVGVDCVVLTSTPISTTTTTAPATTTTTAPVAVQAEPAFTG